MAFAWHSHPAYRHGYFTIMSLVSSFRNPGSQIPGWKRKVLEEGEEEEEECT